MQLLDLTKPFHTQLKSCEKERQLELVEAWEDSQAENGFPDPQTNHFFGNNVYVREIELEANTMMTGRVHLVSHVSMLLSGRLTMWTQKDGLQHMQGPLIMETPAGTKRLVFMHTDCRFATAHSIAGTGTQEPDELKQLLTVTKYSEYLVYLENEQLKLEGGTKCLGSQ